MTQVTSAQQNAGGNRDGSGLPLVPSIPLSDDKMLAAGADQSIGNLVKDATTHVSTLVRAEIELAKSEIAGEVKKGVKGSIFFIIALVILLYSSFFLFFTVAEALSEVFYRWLAFLIVLVVMWLVAGLAAFLGWRKVKTIHAPERTISTVKDTAAVLKNRGHEDAGTNGAVVPHRP